MREKVPEFLQEFESNDRKSQDKTKIQGGENPSAGKDPSF
jgi:hypothetical protein